MISPTGTITSNSIVASWKDVIVNGNISSLTVEDRWLSGMPNGIPFSLYICCEDCETYAGGLAPSPLSPCQTQPAVVPLAGQAVLDADDLLRYILFTDPSNVTGSIIATSNTPEFYFNPVTMGIWTTYYVAAIAGDGIGGSIDMNDYCLSISNYVPVAWQPSPSVEFTADGSCVAAGNCIDVNINFTGLPPFQLSGQVTAGGNVISNFNETYSTNSDILNICLPANIPPGAITVEATSLTDAHCTCD